MAGVMSHDNKIMEHLCWEASNDVFVPVPVPVPVPEISLAASEVIYYTFFVILTDHYICTRWKTPQNQLRFPMNVLTR